MLMIVFCLLGLTACAGQSVPNPTATIIPSPPHISAGTHSPNRN